MGENLKELNNAIDFLNEGEEKLIFTHGIKLIRFSYTPESHSEVVDRDWRKLSLILSDLLKHEKITLDHPVFDRYGDLLHWVFFPPSLLSEKFAKRHKVHINIDYFTNSDFWLYWIKGNE